LENIYNPDFVKGHFDRMSKSYEIMNTITSFGFSVWWRKQFLSYFKKSEKEIFIIDLLSGMGETWSFIKDKFPNSKLHALDFSEEMTKYSELKNKKLFDNSVVIYHDNVLSNQLPPNQFDIVVSSYGLKTFNDEQLNQLAIEVKRILKNGGQFSFVEVSMPKNRLLLTLYGFYVSKIITYIGKVMFKNDKEYQLLWEYTKLFQNARKVVEIFTQIGLKAEYRSYFFGCASGVVGYKE